ncbi:MAG: cobalamin B12-binding domain-containing protein [Syntrophomonas sp.]
MSQIGLSNLRIMIAKPGLDMHDRGAKLIARFLRESGFDVIYSGCPQTPEETTDMAIREKIDLLGLSCLSGAHCHLFSTVTGLLKEKGADNIRVIGGGAIPRQDFQYLYDHGVEAVFPSGSPLTAVKDWIERELINQST